MIEWIEPDWAAPKNVHALCTTRKGGVSQGDWSSLNLADHVNDEPDHVEKNRKRLIAQCQFPAKPSWLQQVHGNQVLGPGQLGQSCADARYTDQQDQVCVVLTADCLPLLICDRSGSQVAAVHAGWRGLAAGVIENTLDIFSGSANDILVWLGPAIGPEVFEVGDDVFEQFTAIDAPAESAFRQNRPGHWLMNIYTLARQRLNKLGVNDISGGDDYDFCTFSDPDRFFSYRRNAVTGRMASLIWLGQSDDGEQL